MEADGISKHANEFKNPSGPLPPVLRNGNFGYVELSVRLF